MYPTLDEIGLRTGTDKSSRHHDYLTFYEEFLGPLRYEPVSVLEIGVLEGSSIAMWSEYFPSGQIVGMDVEPSAKRHEGGRIRVETADQGNVADLLRVAVRHGPFDLVIDDGSHFWDHQITSLRYLLGFVKPGRFYILEDLDTSYGSYVPQFAHGAPESAARYVQRLADYMVGDAVMDFGAEQDAFLRSFAQRLRSITFARRTCVLRLRA